MRIAAEPGQGRIIVTGIMEEEEMGGAGMTMRRRFMASSSLDNVVTVLQQVFACADPVTIFTLISPAACP